MTPKNLPDGTPDLSRDQVPQSTPETPSLWPDGQQRRPGQTHQPKPGDADYVAPKPRPGA